MFVDDTTDVKNPLSDIEKKQLDKKIADLESHIEKIGDEAKKLNVELNDIVGPEDPKFANAMKQLRFCLQGPPSLSPNASDEERYYDPIARGHPLPKYTPSQQKKAMACEMDFRF